MSKEKNDSFQKIGDIAEFIELETFQDQPTKNFLLIIYFLIIFMNYNWNGVIDFLKS